MKRKFSVLPVVLCVFCSCGSSLPTPIIEEFSQFCETMNLMTVGQLVYSDIFEWLQEHKYDLDKEAITALTAVANENFGKTPEHFEFQTAILEALNAYKKWCDRRDSNP